MNSQNWKSTIVNWVNCITPKNIEIREIKDLTDGEVFANLIYCLKTGKQWGAIDQFGSLDYVSEFIQIDYQDFQISKFSFEITENDVPFVASLLLHYCCVVCNNTSTEYRKLMSSNLEPPCQMNIMKFLQNIMDRNQFTRESIACAVAQLGPQFSPTLSCSSPNQEKYLSVLRKTQDDLKKYQSENFNLEEEVKSLTDKCDKLTCERDKVILENKRLRADLTSLDIENTSPNKLEDLRPQLMQLQNEIIVKDNIIEELNRDIELCHIQKIELEEKLNRVNSEKQATESKYLEMELKNEYMEKQVDDKDCEIRKMTEVCSELTLTIEQLKEINKKDQSIDELDLSLSQLPPEVQSRYTEHETLAHSVIDIQLKERENEVRELQQVIKDSAKELDLIKKDMVDIIKQNEELKIENNKLNFEVSECDILKADLISAANQLQSVQTELNRQVCEKVSLQEELKKKTESIQSRDNDIVNLQNAKLEQEEEITSLSKNISDLNIQLTDNICRIQALQSLNSEVNERITFAETALNEKIRSLRIIINGDVSDSGVTDNLSIESSIDILQDLVIKVQSCTNLKNQLIEDVTSLKSELGNASNQIMDLQELNKVNNKEKDQIFAELTNTKAEVSELLKLNDNYKLNIDQLKHVENENEKLVKELSKLKEDLEMHKNHHETYESDMERLSNMVSDKNIKIAKLEEAKINLLEQYNESSSNLTKLTLLLQEKTVEIKQILEERQELSETYDNLHKEFIDMKHDHDSKVVQHNMLQETSKKEIKQLSNEVVELTKENIRLVSEKSNLIAEFRLEKETLQKEKNSTEQKLLDLKTSNSRLQSDVELLNKDISNYQSKLENLEKSNEINKELLEKLQSDNTKQEELSEEILQLNEKIKFCESKCADLTNTISNLNDQIQKCENEKAMITSELSSNLEKLQTYESELNLAISNSKDLQSRLDSLEQALTQSEEQQNNLSRVWEQKIQDKDNTIDKLQDSIDTMQTTISSLHDTINELNIELTLKSNNNEDASQKLHDLQIKKTELNKLVIALEGKCKQTELLLENKEQEKDLLIDEHSKKMYAKDQEIENYIKEINDIKELLRQNESVNTELQKSLEDSETLKKEMAIIEEKNSRLTVELNTTLKELEDIRIKINIERVEHENLLKQSEASIASYRDQNEKDREVIINLQNLQHSSESQSMMLNSQMSELKVEIKNYKVDKAKLEKSLQNEKIDKQKLSAIIDVYEKEQAKILKNYGNLQSTILEINDVLKSVENHTDLEVLYQSNPLDFTDSTSTIDDVSAGIISKNIGRLNSDLQTTKGYLQNLLKSYKILLAICKEKTELEKSYKSLKSESDTIIKDYKQKYERTQLQNELLDYDNRNMKNFVHEVKIKKDFSKDITDLQQVLQNAFDDLQQKLETSEENKVEYMKSTKSDFHSQIDKLVELRNTARTDFKALGELNSSLHTKLQAISGRQSSKHAELLYKNKELDRHFKRLNNHNVTLIETMVSQLLSLIERSNESNEMSNNDFTDLINTIQYVLNDARLIKEELDTSISGLSELSSHETSEYSNDLIEVYSPEMFGYPARVDNKMQNCSRNVLCNNAGYETLKSQYQNLMTTYNGVAKELNDLKLKYNDTLKDLNEATEKRRHDEIVSENLKLQKQLNGLFKQCEAQSNELISMKASNEKLQSDIELVEKKYSLAKLKYIEYDELKIKQIEYLKSQIAENCHSSAYVDSKVEEKVKEVRNEYEGKLEKMKNKMKELYNKEMEKLDKKVQEEKAGLENLCDKYTQKIKNYEAHVANLSTQLFEMGEKYLAEQNEKTALKNELSKLRQRTSFQDDCKPSGRGDHISNERAMRSSTFPRQYKSNKVSKHEDAFVDVIEETITTTKRSVKPLSSVGPSMFMEDEDEIFNNTYLMDLKAGRCEVPGQQADGHIDDSNVKRLSELKWRNSLCPPHLRSSYATEAQLEEFRENDVRVIDTSSTNLLPSDMGRPSSTRWGKERGQGTSYRKPGPPTPSKNAGRNSLGGRNSLLSNELPSSDVLKERNDNKSSTGAIKKVVKATTPNRLRAMFMGSKNNQGNEENESSTPKKRLSLFKRPR